MICDVCFVPHKCVSVGTDRAQRLRLPALEGGGTCHATFYCNIGALAEFLIFLDVLSQSRTHQINRDPLSALFDVEFFPGALLEDSPDEIGVFAPPSRACAVGNFDGAQNRC